MTKTVIRKPDGRKARAYYPGKRRVLTMLTPFAQQVVQAASRRTKRNRADVIEHLVRRWGGSVQRDEFSGQSEAAGR